MAKAFPLEYTEIQLGEYIVLAKRSLFKRVDKCDTFSLANCCGNGAESFECLRDYSESHLELTFVSYWNLS